MWAVTRTIFSGLKGHMQLANTWAEHGLGDELAGIIEGIILGDGWDGADASGRARRKHRRIQRERSAAIPEQLHSGRRG